MAVLLSQWYMLTVVYQYHMLRSSTLQCYINGSLVLSADVTLPVSEEVSTAKIIIISHTRPLLLLLFISIFCSGVRQVFSGWVAQCYPSVGVSGTDVGCLLVEGAIASNHYRCPA